MEVLVNSRDITLLSSLSSHCWLKSNEQSTGGRNAFYDTGPARLNIMSHGEERFVPSPSVRPSVEYEYDTFSAMSPRNRATKRGNNARWMDGWMDGCVPVPACLVP